MAIRNQNWYDLNSGRPYPADDAATLIDDNDVRLPSNIIADLYIKFPESAGYYAYFGAISVTPSLVTVTILAASAPDAAAGFVPLAAVSVRRPVDLRHYPLEALFPGVGGWIVFGSGANATTFTSRFSTPAQSLISPRAAKWYKELPIPDVAKYNNTSTLTGLVLLKGGNDIEIVKECREVPFGPVLPYQVCDEGNSQARDVIVIRLVDTSTARNQRNVFELYSGPCGKRPESNNCGDPPPIEFLGTVSPDCCGNITLVLRGCAEITAITEAGLIDDMGDLVESTEACGVIVDCGLGLVDACVTQDRLPDADGRLPNEYDDLCVSESSIIVAPPADVSLSGSCHDVLVASDDFQVNDTSWITRAGAFEYFQFAIGDDIFRTAVPAGFSARNVAYWATSPLSDFCSRATTTLRLHSGTSGALSNGGIVANFNNVNNSYFAAIIDGLGSYNGAKSLILAKWTGFNWRFFGSVAFNVVTGILYELELHVQEHDEDNYAWLTATATALEGADVGEPVVLGPLAVENYGPVIGKYGVCSERAWTDFHTFSVSSV